MRFSNDLFVFALQIRTALSQLPCIAHVFDNTWPAAPKGCTVWAPFFFLLDLICHHQTWHKAWTWMVIFFFSFFFFERGLMNGGSEERPKSLSGSSTVSGTHQGCFLSTDCNRSHSHSLVLFWSRLGFQQLFGWSVGYLFIYFFSCCKRWFMNNNVLKWAKICIFLALCQCPHLERTWYWQSSNNSNPLMKGIINSSLIVVATFHFHCLKMPKFGIN